MTFHGRFILDAVVSHLAATQDLGQLKQFVLMGYSSGAAGAASNCDDVAAMIRAEVDHEVDVRCILFSDFFPHWIHDAGCKPLANYEMYNRYWQGKLVGFFAFPAAQ